jgi:drug/metabolite transporter (DMT)-like permease
VLAILLALGSSACYGLSNFLGPQLARRHPLVAVLVVSQLAALVLCVAYVVVDGGAPLSLHWTLVAAVAGTGNAVGLILFYRAAQLGPLALVAPIGATGAVIPVVYGLATGDVLHATEAVGLALALGGAVVAARRPEEAQEHEHDLHPAAPTYANPRLSVLLAAASAVAFGAFLTSLPQAAPHGRAWTLLDARLVLLAILLVWAGPRLREISLRPGTASLTVPGLLLVAGTLLYAVAADHAPLSLVSVLGSLFPVVTVGLGVGVLGERITRAQTLGVSAALAGVVLVAL